jgi:ribosomal protein L20A (L18A)
MKKKQKKQKKYFVSLCLKIPANFEVEVKASSEKEAFEKTYDMFDSNNGGCISDLIWEEMELDIDAEHIKKLSSGVHIEEIK